MLASPSLPASDGQTGWQRLVLADGDGSLTSLQLEEEKRKVVAEWVSVEDAQKEYDKKREACVASSVIVMVASSPAVSRHALLSCRGDRFEKVARERFDFLPQDEVVAFNVGGQVRE